MKTGKKKVLKVILWVLALFLLANGIWFVWRAVKYGAYSKGMEKSELPEWLVPRYIRTDDEGFDYLVKYPDYLSLTGNLTVGLPADGDNPFTDFLVVWPKAFGGFEYGVSITEDGTMYQIYIHEDGSAADPKDSGIIERNRDTVNTLLGRANEMWDLG